MTLLFTIKRIEYKGTEYSILLQNENGPCALIAIVNVLLLSQNQRQNSQELSQLLTNKSEINLDDLLQVLANIALKGTSIDNDKTNANSDDTNNNISDTNDSDINRLLKLLPSLHTGLNINPKFDGTFKDSEELSIFRLFNIDLVHGWIMDENISDSDLRKLSYDEYQNMYIQVNEIVNKDSPTEKDEEGLLEKVGILKGFLDDSSTQLTSPGMKYLNSYLKNDSLSVLFRNDHFSTLLKRDDMLYSLITDLGFEKRSDIVWESLISIDGSLNVFCDSDFNLVDLENKDITDPNIETNKNDSDLDRQLALKLQEQEDRRLPAVLNKKDSSNNQRSTTSSKNKSKQKRIKNSKMNQNGTATQYKTEYEKSEQERLLSKKSSKSCSIV